MKLLTKAALATLLGGAALAAGAQTVQPLTPNGGWAEFDVDDLLSTRADTGWIDLSGAALSFTFTLAAPAELRVVDAGFAGDRFSVMVNGATAAATGAVPVTDINSAANLGTDFDAAWADGGAHFSRLALTLGPGSYTVTGALLQSVQVGGLPLNATVGAIALAPVPEPASVATLLTGLLLIASVLRGRGKRRD